MLDPEAVERVDRSRMLDAVLRMGTVLEESLKSLEGLSLPFEEPSAVVSAGMGGSAIAGEIIRCWLMYTSKTPVDVVRGYHLPAYVDEDSLVVAVSYSGETEETVSVLAEALKRGCMTVAVSSGGTVEKLSKTVGMPWIPVPKGLQPRAALPHLLAAQAKVLEAVGVEIPVEELLDASSTLKEMSAELSPDRPVEENRAKKAALSIHGRLPVVYAPESLWPAALRFKTQLNENSKTPAKAEVVPELCHNEVVGFEGSKELLSRMCIVLLRDPGEEAVVRERMEAVKEEAEGRVGGLVEFRSRGSSRIGKMLSAILFGDAVSVYLAVLYGVDPTPVETISRIKRRVARLRVVEKVLDELVRRPLS